MSENNAKVTIGDVVQFGMQLPDAGKLLHIAIGSHGVEYLLSTIVACLNKIKETDPTYSEEKFKELSDKLQKGCANGEGCYLITDIKGDNNV